MHRRGYFREEFKSVAKLIELFPLRCGIARALRSALRFWLQKVITSRGEKRIVQGLEVRMFMVKDPICGMMVDEKTAQIKSAYKGKTYYFCNQSCKTTFDKNPAKYAGA
jgi:YHS domain-containing protein